MYLPSLTGRTGGETSSSVFAHQPPGVAYGTFLVSHALALYLHGEVVLLITNCSGHRMGGNMSIIHFPSTSSDLTFSGRITETILG